MIGVFPKRLLHNQNYGGVATGDSDRSLIKTPVPLYPAFMKSTPAEYCGSAYEAGTDFPIQLI